MRRTMKSGRLAEVEELTKVNRAKRVESGENEKW